MARKSSRIHDPALSQPLCTALQVALADLLASWRIHPSSVIGHSSGEIAAAYCVGAISQESAWKLAYYRGLLASRLMNSCRKRGSMMAVALSEEALAPYMAQVPAKGELAIGCINSPNNTTMTGTEEAIVALKAVLDRGQIFARQLSVGVAYHSVQMEEVADDYLALIQDVFAPDSLPSVENVPLMYSSVSGHPVTAKQLRAGEYWTANMCSQVCFSEALSRMCSATHGKHANHYPNDVAGVNYLIELGPHAALRRPVRESLGQIAYSSALKMDSPATETILHLAGELCCLGYPVNLEAANNISAGTDAEMLVRLPSYPFNHSQTYWHESRLSKSFRFRRHRPHELLGPLVQTGMHWKPSGETSSK